MESVASRVDPDTRRYLESEADRLGTSRSDVVRYVLEDCAEQGFRVEQDGTTESPLSAFESRLEELESEMDDVQDTVNVLEQDRDYIASRCRDIAPTKDGTVSGTYTQ